jgi:hypothetical protein
MKFSSFLAAASAIAAVIAASKEKEDCPPAKYGALYFLDNNPDGASIVAIKLEKDGSLGSANRTPTGGKGLLGVMNGRSTTMGKSMLAATIS